jgi:hypothetical protein
MNHDQFSLPFLDTTSLGGGFGLYDRSPTPKPTPTREDAGLFETPAPDPTASLPTQNRTLAITAHDTGSPAIAVLPKVGKGAQSTISPRSDS